MSCASQTILPPSRVDFWVELSLADDRVGWTLRPLNSENRKEAEPETGGKEADGRAEARGITKASRRPAMANIHSECVCLLWVWWWMSGGESGWVKFISVLCDSVDPIFSFPMMNGWGIISLIFIYFSGFGPFDFGLRLGLLNTNNLMQNPKCRSCVTNLIPKNKWEISKVLTR